MKKAADFFEKYNLIFMIPVIAVYGFTRLFYLGEISYYMHISELQAAYEAFCVARFGSDSALAVPSAFFGGLGEGHSALLIFLGAILMKIKSGYFSLKLFRLISVAAGLFGLVFSYLFAWEWTGKKRSGFVAAAIVTTLPVFFMSQRHSVEDYLLLSILPAAFYFLTAGIKRSKLWLFLLSGMFFAAGLFSCRMAVLMVPAFLVPTAAYLIYAKKIRPGFALALCIPVIAGIAVLFAFSSGSIISADPGSFAANIRRFRQMFWADSHDFNVIADFGTMYVFSIPILITGIVVSFKKVISSFKNREFDTDVLLWMFLLSGTFCCMFVPKVDTRTASPLFFAVTMLIMEGIIFIGDNLKGTFPVLMLILFFSLGLLSYYYFVNYNSQLNHSKDHEKEIIVDKSAGEAVKAALRLYPGRGVTVYTGDDFEGRNLLIALFGGASPADYASFCDSESFSFNDIEVNPAEAGFSYDRVYVIDQAAHPDMIELFASAGWGMTALKEYTLFYLN
ncbi:MAG: glycosyltransferase family 39 protein [Lachnospiraceae bacterium]|nr:glycosyltransferase family 39 protein [Lachnospiraceae bacterium]